MINEEITDIFFSIKTNSLFFIPYEEATELRKKLITAKAERHGREVEDVDLPDIDPPYKLNNRALDFNEIPEDPSNFPFF
jgi:hypothetical protein